MDAVTMANASQTIIKSNIDDDNEPNLSLFYLVTSASLFSAFIPVIVSLVSRFSLKKLIFHFNVTLTTVIKPTHVG